MELERWIEWAHEKGASDLHLEPGLPATLRIRGELKLSGERVSGESLINLARGILGEERWPEFLERCSADLSKTVKGVRCRINVLKSARGVGMAIRLLTSTAVTLKKLNLHPGLSRLVQASSGLILISGPTGSGKTSTAAALLQEINSTESRHIITLENPIEYALASRRSFIRQREIGRDTPSFAQGLYDAMREDPDVLFVGEMREPEVMRLTLNAAETGHLVIATLHSATISEALQRVVSSFPAEIQPGICAQIADCLVGAVAQRLTFRSDPGIRVPECEVLMAGAGARASIRQGQFFKLASVMESGAADGSYSLERYRVWLTAKQDWTRQWAATPDETDEPVEPALAPADLPVRSPMRAQKTVVPKKPPAARPHVPEDGVLVIDDSSEDLSSVLKEIEHRKPK
ncbi:MAG: ATPase, T2SS/T4P/T4SS family [Myxococcota bacterium]